MGETPRKGRNFLSVTVQKRLKDRAEARKSSREAALESAEFQEWQDWYEKHHEEKKQDRGLFPDKNQMKKQLQESLIVKDYDVHDCYWETGCMQWIAKSP